ncbi:MAG TPA: hypothetical protein VGS28_03375 [Candidatus Saccharimonadales bacterium]|nr:hypothetical protein [Candidatus Saccharimonadales bacterium]
MSSKSGTKTALLVIVSLIVIAAAAGATYYWQHKKVNNLSNQATTLQGQVNNLNKQVSSLKGKLPTSSSPSQSTNSANGLVKDSYDTVLTYEQQHPGVSQAEINTIKSNMTTGLYNWLTASIKSPGADPILCAQAVPASVSVSDGSTSGGNLTVLVTESFGTSTSTVTTTVNLSSNKLASITCPQ